MDNQITYEYYIRSDKDGYGMGPWNKVTAKIAEKFFGNEYYNGTCTLSREIHKMDSNDLLESIIDAPYVNGRLVGQVKVLRNVPGYQRLRDECLRLRDEVQRLRDVLITLRDKYAVEGMELITKALDDGRH